MPTILRVLLYLCLFAVGLVLAGGMLVAAMLLLGFWSARSLYLKLTGRRVPPFTAVFRPGGAFRARSSRGNVIDVEARHLP